MTNIKLPFFRGLVPRRGEQNMEQGQAVKAVNTDLDSGELRPLITPHRELGFAGGGGGGAILSPVPVDPSGPIPEVPVSPGCIPVVIVVPPENQTFTVLPGMITFAIQTNLNATAPVMIRWYIDDVLIPGETEETLTITPDALQIEYSEVDFGPLPPITSLYGVIKVVVQNPCGTAEAFATVAYSEVLRDAPECKPYECSALYDRLVLDGGNIWDMTDGVVSGPIPGASYRPPGFLSNLGDELDWDQQVLIGDRDGGGSNRNIFWRIADTQIDLCELNLPLALGFRSSWVNTNFDWPRMPGYAMDTGTAFSNIFVYSEPMRIEDDFRGDPALLFIPVEVIMGPISPSLRVYYGTGVGWILEVSEPSGSPGYPTELTGDPNIPTNYPSVTQQIATLPQPAGHKGFNVFGVEAVMSGLMTIEYIGEISDDFDTSGVGSPRWYLFNVTAVVNYKLFCNGQSTQGSAAVTFQKVTSLNAFSDGYGDPPVLGWDGTFSVNGPNTSYPGTRRLSDDGWDMDTLYMGVMPVGYDYNRAWLALHRNFIDFVAPVSCLP